jgi:signal transduction histidine kinase
MASSRRGDAVDEPTDAERGEVLRLAAHDLKNPLTAVRVLAEMLLEDVPAAHRADLVDLMEAVDLAAILADSLSDLGRVESGEEALRASSTCDLGAVIAEVAGRPAFAPGVTFRPEPASTVRGDGPGVERLLASVLLNGRRMLGPTDRLHVQVSGAVVEVRHPGLVLAADDRLALLDLYGGARLKVRRVRAAALGLGYARHALDAIGGRVALEARPDGLIARLEFVEARPG